MTESVFHDLKVLDFSWVVAGPAIGRVLADYGATVIRVETTKRVDTARLIGPFHKGLPGVENSALYGNVNAGKLGFALDMTNEHAREVILDLVRWADILVESFSPGVMKRWGLEYETLCKIRPDLIMLSTSLMGGTGPYSNFAGYGNIGAAVSSCMNIGGWPDKPPRGPFGPYTDYVGPRFSLVTLLAALDQRGRTGQGCNIDLSQAEAGIHFLAQGMLDYYVNGKVTERMGNRDLQMAPHGVYPCRDTEAGDSSFVAIAVRNDAEWKRLATLVNGEKLANDVRFVSIEDRLLSCDLLDEIIGEWTAQMPANEVETLLQSNHIPAHNVASSVDALSDPQLQYQGHFIELDHPLHRKTVVEGARYKFSDTTAVVTRPAPTYGQDNEYILRYILNYDANRIAELETAGLLK
ncbi:CaiB/BaiF CoA transferase family protein [Peribacillus frigoritolerans]|uniref:CaiB/BaiF CoA transferase family protein n=1 Tax=Peribacillus frigoritolerans TaxID=450367 RepID=UPI0038196071